MSAVHAAGGAVHQHAPAKTGGSGTGAKGKGKVAGKQGSGDARAERTQDFQAAKGKLRAKGSAPGKTPSKVGGAHGAHTPPSKTPPSKVAGATGGGATAAADGALDGAAAIGTDANVLGGGPDLSAVLQSLLEAVTQLTKLITGMVAGGGGGGIDSGCDGGMKQAHVAGVQGSGADGSQFVNMLATPVTSSGREDNDFEQRVLDLINVERARYGLSKVTHNEMLDQAATKHNRQMALTGTMAHSGIGDGDPGERIRAEGFRNSWGENVATGQSSPEQVVREWMASPTHRRNILDPNFRQMGVAYTTSANGRSFWAQEFGA